MRITGIVLVALTAWLTLTGCSGPPPLPPQEPVVPAPTPEQQTAIQDWSMEGAVQVPPMRMDAVMATVDERLVAAGRSRMRSVRIRRGQPEAPDQTGAPYFHVPSGDGSTESLPLKSTSARVNIAGVIAQVLVTQVYQNRGQSPIEAVYVFPASTRAAVHGMRMTIGSRTIVARIDEREKARADYEAAKEEGKRASLLEQQRPNVFTMNVANIMPGDVIKTELLYSELLVPEEGVYNFIYPTVVGPRNPMGSDPKTTGWVANPTLHEGQPEPYGFDVKVHLASPIALKEVSSPSHPVDVSYQSPNAASISLKQAGGGNRDYVLRYRLSGDRIESGAMLYDHGGEKFFLMMMEPPARVQQQQIPSREYIFVLDVSGSMHGFPLDTAKELMRNLLGRMRPTDYFNVVLFSGRAGVLNPQSLPATPANVQQSMDTILKLRGGGGTNLMDALRTCYELPPPAGGPRSRSMVVVTDGYVSVEAQAFRYIRKRLNQANLFAFGIGSSVNRALIEGMARAGMGSPFVVLDKSHASEKAAKLRQYIESPLLTNIEVSVQGIDVYDGVPKALPDLMAARPLILFGKYRGSGKGVVRIVGAQGMGKFESQIELDPATARPANRPLRSLWARKWVEQLMDQFNALGGDEDIKKAVTNLGLGYSLLTQFTSFVAIDSQVANTTGQLTTTKQPLPLPKGVSDYAVPSSSSKSRRGMALSPLQAGGYGAGGASVSGGSVTHRRPVMPPPRRAPAPAEAEAVDASAPPPPPPPPTEPAAARQVQITRMSNIKQSQQARLTVLVVALISQCAKKAGFTGTLTIRIQPDGRIVTSGGNPALKQCLQSQRVIDRLASGTSKQMLDDPSRPGIVVLRIQ